ncbi:hypothetical protein D917_07138 [Trichinella nativa]|uniref:Uncharacterized protein n=1 Tax=Trichinella nativa TaxID=6335 RepID=A0A1Y3EQV9_9BILA|nr:hypothetical protein D917_07138 [Trichinella nativa]
MAKLGVAERAAGSSCDAAAVANDAASVNDAADNNAGAVSSEDKPRPAGSRPTSSANSRVSSRDVLRSS